MEALHEICMNDASESSLISEKDFQTILKQISKKGKDKYQFILKAEKTFHYALFALYRRVCETVARPSTWENTKCIHLYKGKGRRDEFSNRRFIHMKDEQSETNNDEELL